MTKTNIIIAIITLLCVGALVGGVQLYNAQNASSNTISSASNITIVDGVQHILITAGQGYSPQITTAKANMPTQLTIQGKNAYGCESAVRIPELHYAKNLGPAGSDTITLSEQQSGAVINGTCTMGMYNFQIKFQ